MSKPTTLTIWQINTAEGTEFFPTRKAAAGYIKWMAEQGETGYLASQKPFKREIALSGRTLMDAFFVGIRVGQECSHG